MAISYIRNVISAGYNLVKINENFVNIATALQNALSRTGTGPNQMQADIDMNSNDLLNVGNIDVQGFTIDGNTFDISVAAAAAIADTVHNDANAAAASAAAAAASAAIIDPSSYYVKSYIDANYYTKAQVDSLLSAKANVTDLLLAAPVGTILALPRTTAPTGFIKANGAAVSRTTYSALFAIIGTTYGAGDGSTTFNVPDLRAEFIRGLDDGRSVDSGRSLGTAQGHQLQDHTHFSARTLDGTTLSVGGTGYDIMAENGAIDATARSGLVTGGYNSGAETRPRNQAMLFCIKY